MSETVYVVAFVVIVYSGFYFLAFKAEKEVKAKARENRSLQSKTIRDPGAERVAAQKKKASKPAESAKVYRK